MPQWPGSHIADTRWFPIVEPWLPTIVIGALFAGFYGLILLVQP